MKRKNKIILGFLAASLSMGSISTLVINSNNNSKLLRNIKQETKLEAIENSNEKIVKAISENNLIEQKIKSSMVELKTTKELEEQLRIAYTIIDQLEKDSISLRTMLDITREQFYNLQEEKISLDSELESYKKEIERLILENEDLKDVEILLQESKDRIEELENSLREKDKEIEESNKQLDILNKEKEGLISSNTQLEEEVRNKEIEISDLTDDRNKLSNDLSTLKEELNNIKEENLELKSLLEELEGLRIKVIDLEGLAKAKDDIIESKEREIESLQETIFQNQKDYEYLFEELQQANKTIEELQEDRIRLESIIQDYQNLLDEKDIEISNLKKENSELQNQILNLQSQYNAEILPDFQVITITSNEYKNKIKETGIDIFLSEIDSWAFDTRLLLELISKNFEYKNLEELVNKNESLEIDISTLKFSKWYIDSEYKLNSVENIDYLLDLDILDKNNKISLSFDVVDKSSLIPIRKNINLAFNVLNITTNIEDEWNSLFNDIINSDSSRLQQKDSEPYFLINIDNYDKEIEIINSYDSRRVIKELFNSDIIIPSYYQISHNIVKIGEWNPDSNTKAIIKQNELFNSDGYALVFSIKVKSLSENKNIFETYKGVQVAIESNELTSDENGISINPIRDIDNSTYGTSKMYASVLSSRIDNLKKQMDINDEMKEEELRKKHLFVSKYSEMMLYYKVKNGIYNANYSDVADLLTYIFSDFDKKDIYKLHESIGYNTPQHYLRKANADKGFINSNIEKSFDLKLFDRNLWIDSKDNLDKMKVDIKIDYSKVQYPISNNYEFYLYDTLGRITITFKHESGIENNINFYYANSVYQEDKSMIDYLILNDLVQNANPDKASYNTRTNTVTINTTRDLFNKYLENTKEVLNNQNWKTQYELIKTMNEIVDNNNSLKNLHEYYSSNLLFYNKYNALEKIKEQIDWIQKSPSNRYETLFAGGATDVNDFGFHIIWNISN